MQTRDRSHPRSHIPVRRSVHPMDTTSPSHDRLKAVLVDRSLDFDHAGFGVSIDVIYVLSPTQDSVSLLIVPNRVVDFLVLREVDDDRSGIGAYHGIGWMSLLPDDNVESPHVEEEDSEVEHLVLEDVDDEAEKGVEGHATSAETAVGIPDSNERHVE